MSMCYRVYLHEFNILMGKRVYLPNVSGMLRAYAESIPAIKEAFRFMPFLFIRGVPGSIADQWEDPAVLAFSSSMWNQELNLVLAREAKKRFPNVLVVFGGPHVPADSRSFLARESCVDMVVRGEGEVPFAGILAESLNGRNFGLVPSLAFRCPQTGEIALTEVASPPSVDDLPSPYLGGLYEYLFANGRDDGTEYQVILETNRGCPFPCSFCYWGNGNAKVRQFSLERVRQEIDWLAERKISFVFGADANFGMFPRDVEIAEMFAKTKQNTGHPQSFRVCFGKNATDRVFETARVLEDNGLTRGVTVSFQSTDPETLVNIGRKNIKIETYRELLRRYRQAGISVYTELILGLPGETYESFRRGVEEVFQAGLYDQVGIFLCQVLPNTEMADPGYQERHGIRTRPIELVETHASLRQPGEVPEFEEVVIATNSMPTDDWRRSATLAWAAQAFHGLKLGFFVALYLFNRYGTRYTQLLEHLIDHGHDREQFPVFWRCLEGCNNHLDQVLAGRPQCLFLDGCGDISWQSEEATFLTLAEDWDPLYREFENLVRSLISIQPGEESDLLSEVFLYQRVRMVSLYRRTSNVINFRYNLPEYFDGILTDEPVELRHVPQTLTIVEDDYEGDKPRFAREVIWYGRRHSRCLARAKWS